MNKCLIFSTVFVLILVSVWHSAIGAISNDLPGSQYYGRKDEYIDSKYSQAAVRGGGWVDTAKSAMAGPAGQMVVSIAKELLSRSAGNSQVLSLNLTNLLILILLKALIFAAGMIGAGNWGQYARGRSLEGSMFEYGETPLFLGFLAAEGSGQDGCMSLAACRAPNTAIEYVKAAKAVLKGSEILDSMLPYNGHYNELIYKMEQAAREGIEGAPCDMIYGCRM